MLGYLAYVLICAFGPVQLFNMVRGRHVELGNLPLFVLLAGLGLLQFQIIRDGAPTYILWGNGVALAFNVINLAWVFGDRYRVRHALDRSLREHTRYTLTPKGRHFTKPQGGDFWSPR